MSVRCAEHPAHILTGDGFCLFGEHRPQSTLDRYPQEAAMQHADPSLGDMYRPVADDPQTEAEADLELSGVSEDCYDGPARDMECFGDYEAAEDACRICDHADDCLAESESRPAELSCGARVITLVDAYKDWDEKSGHIPKGTPGVIQAMCLAQDVPEIGESLEPDVQYYLVETEIRSEYFSAAELEAQPDQDAETEETSAPDVFGGLSGPAEPYQPTLDDRVFGGYQLRSVKVTVVGSFSVPLRDLQAWAAQSNPLKLGRDAEITLQAVIEQAVLTAKGTGVAGTMRIKANDLLKLHIQETAYVMAEKAEAEGEDEDGDDQERPDLEAAADALLGEGEPPAQDEALPFEDLTADPGPPEGEEAKAAPEDEAGPGPGHDVE